MKRLDPKAVWLFFFSSLIQTVFTVIFMAIILVFNSYEDGRSVLDLVDFNVVLGVSLILVAVVAVLSYIWGYLQYTFYKYEITEDAFRRESGIIRKKYISIPYERIQNVDIHRGPITQILGLSDLHIQTAGISMPKKKGMWGADPEGRLPGLKPDIAEALRTDLIRRAKDTGGDGGV